MTPGDDHHVEGESGLHTPVGTRRSFFSRITAGIAGLKRAVLAATLSGEI